jgi:Rnk N-terminus
MFQLYNQRRSAIDRSAIHVTEQDVERLRRLVAKHETGRDAAAAEQLETELDRAVVVPPDELPADVVTMNSRVVFEDEMGRRRDFQLVYPWQARPARADLHPRSGGRRAARTVRRTGDRLASSERQDRVAPDRGGPVPAGGGGRPAPVMRPPQHSRCRQWRARCADCCRHTTIQNPCEGAFARDALAILLQRGETCTRPGTTSRPPLAPP